MANKLYTVYDTQTGKVLRTGSVPEDDIKNQFDESNNEALLADVAVDSETHEIDVNAGEIVAQNQNRRGALDQIFDKTRFAPVDPIQSLIDRVAALEEQMKKLLG